MKLTQTALKFNVTVYVLIFFIGVVGVVSYVGLPLEAQPEVEVPIMFVSTVYPGVAPVDMERLVTNAIEGELKDLKGLKKMSSTSSESVSTVTVEFETGVDLDVAYQKVRDKVDKAKPKLPADAEEPVIIEINLSDFPMMLVNISGGYALDELKTVAEEIEDEIEAIPGVLGVDLTGGIDREIQVYLDPRRLEYYKLGVGQVIMRIQQEHLNTPAGNLELSGNKYSVRIPGEYKDVSKMEDIVLKAPEGDAIRLRDVGRVVDGFKERETISRIDGAECVTLRVKKRAGANIVEIADKIHALLAEELPGLPEGTAYTVLQDNAEFVRATFRDLTNSIMTGMILVLGVLLFAMGVRNAFFVALAIPLSMLSSFIIIDALGITMNMVVLFSLILALGMLVDNSIVVVENIYRHVSEGAERRGAALTATSEVAWPIIASTTTTVLAFAPLLFWPGIMGDFMKYLPITVIAVLSSSLFVALVINPVIAADFLKPGGKKLFDDSGEPTGVIISRYNAVLRWGLRHYVIVLAVMVALLVGVFALFSEFNAGQAFFPQPTPERGQVSIRAPQGTSLSQTDDLVREVEAIAGREPNMKNVVANAGSGGGFLVGPGGSSHQGVVDLEFKDRREWTGSTWDTVASVREKLGRLPGAEFQVKVEEGGPPSGEPVSIEVYGPDYDVLAGVTEQIEAVVRGIDGVVDLRDDYEAGKPEIRIEIDREKAMRRKINTQSVSQAVRAAINGIEASVLREGDEEHDIVVRYDERFRTTIEDILDIRVTGKDDVQIPLRDVARVYSTGGLGSINHIDQKRTIAVTSDVSGRTSPEVMEDAKRRVRAEVELPPGVHVRFTGQDEEQRKAFAFLGKAFGIGIGLMLLVLITQFNSVLRPGVILGSVVLSTIGVFIGLLISQDKFSIMSMVGIISLAGVVVNNAIVLIDYTDQLKNKHGLALEEALVRAGLVRFRPVLLTAITTVLGLLPMALEIGVDFTAVFDSTRSFIDLNAPSMEMWGPMARAVSYGLVFATVLTLIVVPVMYLAQERFVRKVLGLFGRETEEEAS